MNFKFFTLIALTLALFSVGIPAHATTVKNSGIHVQEYVWDFAVDGGTYTNSPFVLSAKAGKSPLPIGAIVLDVVAKTETAVTGASSTYEWGNADTDGYSGSAIAVATLTAVGYTEQGVGALVWDDTNDVRKPYYISSAADGAFKLTINTASATAGKIRFYVTYLY